MKPDFCPRNTEESARKTLSDSFQTITDVIKSQDPRAWEYAQQLLEECIEATKITARKLEQDRKAREQQEVTPAQDKPRVSILPNPGLAPTVLVLSGLITRGNVR